MCRTLEETQDDEAAQSRRALDEEEKQESDKVTMGRGGRGGVMPRLTGEHMKKGKGEASENLHWAREENRRRASGRERQGMEKEEEEGGHPG